jgi:hypothetical protein
LCLQAEGEDLLLEAEAPPSGDLLDLFRQHKRGVIRLLNRECRAWTDTDWQAYWAERAAIAEYDGGQPRDKAEAQAFAACVAEWLDQHPVCSEGDRCVHCLCPEDMSEPLLPCRTEHTGLFWLHPDCWPAWYAGRKATAAAALLACGITEGRSLV